MNDNVNYQDRVYFVPGDNVTLKHPLENKPEVMLVKKKIENVIKNSDGSLTTNFAGIQCIWFDKNNVLREAIFSTKDLMHV